MLGKPPNERATNALLFSRTALAGHRFQGEASSQVNVPSLVAYWDASVVVGSSSTPPESREHECRSHHGNRRGIDSYAEHDRLNVRAGREADAIAEPAVGVCAHFEGGF